MSPALVVIAAVLVTLRIVGLVAMLPPRGLPPATSWAIRRAHRRNRADLRTALPDRRWVPPARRDF